jgi:hypothetical protein
MESAQRDGVHLRRVAEEIALTGIYLSAFAHWMFDDTDEAESTRRFLDQLLRRAAFMARCCSPFSGSERERQVHEQGVAKPGGEEGIESN